MAKNHGSQIKDDEQYEALRRKGMSKGKAARIANSDKKKTGQKGGHASQYEDWSKKELMAKAREIGLEGRSKLNKNELIKKLRYH